MAKKVQTISTTNFKLPNQVGPVFHGKVRDTYKIGDKYLVAVATDRISAFDVILPQAIPYKGQVLNQVAQHFLETTTDIVPNWLVEVPDPNVSIGLLCEPFKIEMVIRGCLIGYAWRHYQAGNRSLCGVTLPDGLQEYDIFPEPIITPSTKADEGHDEDISAQQIVKQGLASATEFVELSRLARALFKRGQKMAAQQGLLLADTKYEFGRLDGQIYLIDEVHTPDSSRYFYQESYQTYLKQRSGERPKHLSKEFVREWLMANGFQGKSGQTVPDM
ncbi:MAG: phosphoribosylaminoimidazolesuccinocarboxamide synthase, partial [Candidatus Saccharimonadales bacterium]